MWLGIEKALLCGRYDRRMSASIRKNAQASVLITTLESGRQQHG
jgi:hypothetical protein